jgi:hypothetical protein
MIKYVSWDPGQTTGMVHWNEKGEPINVKELKGDEALDEALDELEPATEIETFIIEEYRVYGSKAIAHVGSKVLTAQVIGNLKAWARRHNIKVVEQRSDIKNIAAKWSQTKIPKGHMPDWMAAYLHGYYYLHNKGLIRAKVLDSGH